MVELQRVQHYKLVKLKDLMHWSRTGLNHVNIIHYYMYYAVLYQTSLPDLV